jgi:hypothetical protein
VFVKKDIPAREGAGYRSPIEIQAAKRTDQKHRNIVETRKGTKTNRAGLEKRECNSAQRSAFAAIIAPRERILEGAASIFGHRFFGHAHYFHDARISGMMA